MAICGHMVFEYNYASTIEEQSVGYGIVATSKQPPWQLTST
jgi:hypothetical protein